MPARPAVAGAHYDRIARWYGVLVDPFERRPRDVALRLLAARPGERVLEIGSGTGRAIVEIARAVGPAGHVDGIDASRAMCRIADRRARDAGVSGHVELAVGDALRLPYPDACFDAVFACFTIEVLGEARGSDVLRECRRVLRPRGRIVLVSLSDRGGRSVAARLYRRAHALLPDVVDCAPIPLPAMLRAADLAVAKELHLALFGLPVDVVCAFRRRAAGTP